jgi:Putative zinc-binding metallo-peptidase
VSPASRRLKPNVPPPGRYPWARSDDERLLDLRPRDLGLRLKGTWIEDCLAQVHAELERRGLRYRPHVWLSSEWFSPEGSGGIAVPFVLAHPRLLQLERRLMFEVEGDTREECLRILRHEMGHAYDTAYRLHRRRAWRRAFGSSSQSYPEVYRPDPASRRFVQHLRLYYAQAHPDEDFAETFAVWLGPRAAWRRRYAGWPALRKLEAVDALMAEVAREPVPRMPARPVDPVSQLRLTLRRHYDEKRQRFSPARPEVSERELLALFRTARAAPRAPSAAAFLRKNRAALRRLVARATGEFLFTVDQVLADMIQRSRALDLRAAGPEARLRELTGSLLSARTVHHHYSRTNWVAL